MENPPKTETTHENDIFALIVHLSTILDMFLIVWCMNVANKRIASQYCTYLTKI